MKSTPKLPGSRLPYLTASTMPTSPERNEQITKHQIFTRRTGTPASAAPSRFPTVAMIRVPKRVRVSTTAPRIVIADTQMISDQSHAPMNLLEKFGDPVDAESGIGDACASFE